MPPKFDLPPPEPPKPAKEESKFKLDLPPPPAPKPISITLPPPAPPAPPPPPKPVDPLDKYVEACKQIDNFAASSEQFLKGKIAEFVKMPSWINWGQIHLEKLEPLSDKQAQLTHRLGLLNTATWIEETLKNSTRKMNAFERLLEGDRSPAYYDAQLRRTRAELASVENEITTISSGLDEMERKLRVDTMIMQAVTQNNVYDATVTQIVDGRLRSLITGRQTLQMIINSLATTRGIVIKNMQEIDQLLTVTIPAWKVAYGR